MSCLSLSACSGVNVGRVILAVFIGWLVVLVLHALSQGKASETSVYLYFVQAGLLIGGSYANWLQWIGFFNVSLCCLLTSSFLCVAVFSSKRVAVWWRLCDAIIKLRPRCAQPLRPCAFVRSFARHCFVAWRPGRCRTPPVLEATACCAAYSTRCLQPNGGHVVSEQLPTSPNHNAACLSSWPSCR